MTITNTTQLTQQLADIGFQPGSHEYHRRGIRVRVEPRWLTFHTSAVDAREPLFAVAGVSCWPGLWKIVGSPGGCPRCAFDLPRSTVTAQEIWDDTSGSARRPLAEMIDWVDATRSGDLPAKWQCPPREELETFLPANALTVETGRFARQGQLCCDSGRLSVSVPMVQRLPVALASLRRACLDGFLADIRNRSRMVRLVESETNEGVRNILAEVDLSGARDSHCLNYFASVSMLCGTWCRKTFRQLNCLSTRP